MRSLKRFLESRTFEAKHVEKELKLIIEHKHWEVCGFAIVRKQQIARLSEALDHFRAASGQLIESLAPLSGVNLEIAGAADNARNLTGFVGVGVEAALVQARAYLAGVLAGSVPLVMVEAKPIAVAPKPPAKPVERRLIYLHQHSKWTEPDGSIRYAHQWCQADVPVAVAKAAVARNLADYFNSPRAERLREVYGVVYGLPHRISALIC
jgi:hypothetical protein